MNAEQHIANAFLFLGSIPAQHFVMFFIAYLFCGAVYSLYEQYISVRNLVRYHNNYIEEGYGTLSLRDRELYEKYAGSPVPTFNAAKVNQAWIEDFRDGGRKLYSESETIGTHRRTAYDNVNTVFKRCQSYVEALKDHYVGWSCIMFWPFILPYRMLKEPAKYIYEQMINMYNNVKAFAVNRLAKDIG
jgi:hypothetical protein